MFNERNAYETLIGTTLDRRSALKLGGAGLTGVALTVLSPGMLGAQDATPGATRLFSAEELGLPELVIRQTDEGYEAPAEIAAGRYLVTVENAMSQPFSSAGFIAVTDVLSAEDVQARFAEVNAYFAAIEAGTPPAGDDPSLFLYEATILGGPVAVGEAGVGQAIIDMPPGEYVIWFDEFEYPTSTLLVTGETPDAGPDPESTFSVTGVNMDDHFDFEIEGTPVAGAQWVKVTNDSDQPHFLYFVTSPVPLDDEQWLAVLSIEEGATPEPDSGLPSLEEVVEHAGTATQSRGQTMWAALDLQPGHYGIFCFIPDPNAEGVPHSAMGMIASFSVA